jgi:uncharacterized protein with von Willebrand factor type A (vWA) domain
MDPYVGVVQTLFNYARSQFKDLKIFYFHNTIYDFLWEDPARYRKPQAVADMGRLDPETRVVIVGDASMAPYELMATEGSIHVEERTWRSSLDSLQFLASTFPHALWLNPVPLREWEYTYTVKVIQKIFPMFELTLEGLEKAVIHLMKKR